MKETHVRESYPGVPVCRHSFRLSSFRGFLSWIHLEACHKLQGTGWHKNAIMLRELLVNNKKTKRLHLKNGVTSADDGYNLPRIYAAVEYRSRSSDSPTSPETNIP